MARIGQAVLRGDRQKPLEALRQISPCLRHPQEKNPTLRIGLASGHLNAVCGIQPVTGDVFQTYQSFQAFPDAFTNYPVSFDITLSRELRHRSQCLGLIQLGPPTAAVNPGYGEFTPLIFRNLLSPVAFCVVAIMIEALL